MDDATLIEKIKEAFQSVEYPGDTNLIAHPEYQEPYEMLQAFKGKRWQEVDVELGLYWRMNMSSFTTEAFQYYLPGFMIAALDEESIDMDVFLVATLKPPTDPSMRERFLDRISLLTAAQRSVVYEFLKGFYDDNPHYSIDQDDKTLSFWRPQVD